MEAVHDSWIPAAAGINSTENYSPLPDVPLFFPHICDIFFSDTHIEIAMVNCDDVDMTQQIIPTPFPLGTTGVMKKIGERLNLWRKHRWSPE